MHRGTNPAVVLVVGLAGGLWACGHPGGDFDAGASTDASADAPCLRSFSEAESEACLDAGDSDAGVCADPPPESFFRSDAGFPVGCRILSNDRPAVVDGSCAVPTMTCVAGSPPSWDVSWAPL